MSKLLRWLRGDLYRAKVGEREIAAKRWHGLSVVGIVTAVILILALGVFIGYSYPYKTVAPPPVPPGQITPKSNAPDCNGTVKLKGHEVPGHSLGGCLPQPTIQTRASITATDQGPDLSNNDPVFSDAAWAQIAAHNAFSIFKVNQGTYYNDTTAGPMAAAAKRRGLVVGGYDFLHVCGSSPQAEAQFFVRLATADGLLYGRNVLVPAADAEYPLGAVGCNARDYIYSWIVEVHRLTNRWAMVYTGAWWWDPHVGCWWPGNSISWVSGYTSTANVLARYMPCGLRHLDIHQFSSSAWNGAIASDLSIWRAGVPAFVQASNGTPPGPSAALTRSRIAARGASLHAFYRGPRRGYGCHQPVQTTGFCGQMAWRVDHFQKLVDQAHGYYPHCFGHDRNLGAAICQIVRPAVAAWSRAESQSHKAFGAKHCTPPYAGPVSGPRACRVLYGRELYFQGRINHTLATSRF